MCVRKQRGVVAAACLMTLLAAVGATAASDELVDAARNQDRARVRDLLGRNVDVNAKAEDGSTALLWSAHWNDVATADLLTRAHADTNIANDFGMTPLSRACTNG